MPLEPIPAWTPLNYCLIDIQKGGGDNLHRKRRVQHAQRQEIYPRVSRTRFIFVTWGRHITYASVRRALHTPGAFKIMVGSSCDPRAPQNTRRANIRLHAQSNRRRRNRQGDSIIVVSPPPIGDFPPHTSYRKKKTRNPWSRNKCDSAILKKLDKKKRRHRGSSWLAG